VYPQLRRSAAPLRSTDPVIPEKLDRAVLSWLERHPRRRPFYGHGGTFTACRCSSEKRARTMASLGKQTDAGCITRSPWRTLKEPTKIEQGHIQPPSFPVVRPGELTMCRRPNILIVDDEEPALLAMSEYFTCHGFAVDCSRDQREAKALLGAIARRDGSTADDPASAAFGGRDEANPNMKGTRDEHRIWNGTRN
jgi:hypothetical protein